MLPFRKTRSSLLWLGLLACAACGDDAGAVPREDAGKPPAPDAGHETGDGASEEEDASTSDSDDAGADAGVMIERPDTPEGWTERKRFVPPEGTYSYQPRVALAAHGVARLVVNGRRLWALDVDTAGTLGAPTQLAEFPGDNSPALAKGPNGTLLLVYPNREDDTYNGPEAATVMSFDPNTGWGAPEAFAPFADREIRDMEVTIANDGSAGATWLESASQDSQLGAALFDGTGWTSYLLDPSAYYDLAFPSISLDGQGHALIAWRSDSPVQSGTTGSVALSRYFDGALWSDDTFGLFKEPDNEGGYLDLEYVGDTGVVVWTEYVMDEGYRLFHRAFASEAWSAPGRLDEPSAGSVNSVPRLIRAGDDGLIAFWAQEHASGLLQHWSARYELGTWSQPEPVSAPGIGESRVEAAAAGDGSAIMVFSMRTELSNTDAFFSVWTSHYEPGTGWSEPVQHDDGDTRLPRYSVDIDDAGNVVLAWERESEVWVSRTVQAP